MAITKVTRRNDARNTKIIFFVTVVFLVIDRRKSEGLLIKQVVGNEGETTRFEESLVLLWEKDIRPQYFEVFPEDTQTSCTQGECRYSTKFNRTGDNIGTFTIRDVQLRDSAEYTVLDYYRWYPKVRIYFRVLSVNDTNCTFIARRQLTNIVETNLNRTTFTGNCNIVLRSNVKSDTDNENLLRGSFMCNDRNGNLVNVYDSTPMKFNENTKLSLRNITIEVNRNNGENSVVSRYCFLRFEIIDGITSDAIYTSNPRYYDIEVY